MVCIALMFTRCALSPSRSPLAHRGVPRDYTRSHWAGNTLRTQGYSSKESTERQLTLREGIGALASELSAEALFTALLLPQTCFAAEDTVSYDPSSGNEFLVNAAGVGYVLIVASFLFRILTKRAKRFREEKISESPSLFGGTSKSGVPSIDTSPQKKLTVVDGLIGVAQSAVLTVGLFLFTTKVDAVVLSAPLPDQYTAHNMAVTVRTIIRGFCYLFTFIFGMNCVGLTGLTLKLMLDPDSVNEDALKRPIDIKPRLPKISVVSDPEEVAKAFDKVAKKSPGDDIS